MDDSPYIWLYIRSFLHQTTTLTGQYDALVQLYIRSFSTSNHNQSAISYQNVGVVYPFFSTSNHNSATYYGAEPSVVYPFFSTSNHNFLCEVDDKPELYIRSFLHQTTTRQVRWNDRQRCISVLFYIKPQPSGRLTPASISCISVLFLHQTTTGNIV